MKLAQALAERAAVQTRIAEIEGRLAGAVLVQGATARGSSG